ncbi:MAG TPA: phosphotransferase [Myxococcales bacterium]|jgi:trehalose synthase-fused probable maltokinase
MDFEALPAWLVTRRWFGGKDAAIAGVTAADEALVGDLRVLTLEVTYRDRPKERYLLPMRGESLDEALDEEACRALFEVVRGSREIKTRRGRLRGENFDAALDAVGRPPRVRRLTAEQSNTSIVFDDAVILKLIRKLEPGRNPELEVGAKLKQRGFRATPTLLGALTLETDGEATVGVAHRFVHVDGDGWSYVLSALKGDAQKLLGEVRELGARVGELHVALADPSDPAFAPEPIGEADLRRWTATLARELERTLRVASAAVPELSRRREGLESHIARLARTPPAGVRLRQHGDLHLGQVLRSDGAWLIFDFEGEPARPLAERREKYPPLKDVAGMLRSFAYAIATVERSGSTVSASRKAIREAFLDGYRSRAAALLPADQRGTALLLELFELEKLLYELRYEVGHRPDWIGIPARDLLQEA